MSSVISRSVSKTSPARHPITRTWRMLFAAWDEPHPGPPILLEARTQSAGSAPTSPADRTKNHGEPADLPPAPLYFGYDDAETSLLRLLEASVANALEAIESEATPPAPAVTSHETAAERRAS